MIAYALRKCGQAVLTLTALLWISAFLATSGGTDPGASTWLVHTLHFDFGHTADGVGVGSAIATALPASALLAGGALLITLICGWGGGLLLALLRARSSPCMSRTSSRHWIRNLTLTLGETFAVVVSIAQALPVFWVGALLITLCSVGTGWLPPGGIASTRLPAFGTNAYRALFQSHPATALSDLLAHLALPAITLSIVGVATDLRLIGGVLPAELRAPHARVARATGLPRWRLLRRAVRPSLPIMLAGSASLMPIAFSALIVVEYLFAWPGIGLLAFHAAREGDTATLAVLLPLFGLLVIMVDLVADLLSAWIDPRQHRQDSIA